MIQTVTVTNPNGESLELDLFNPYKTGLAITGIDGIGANKANVNISELATMDGGIFSSARVSPRNIVLKLAMLGCPTVEDARQKTYRYFPLKKKIELSIKTDNRHVRISGIVEGNEPDIFSSSEMTSISILCPDPNFYSYDEQISESQVKTPNFEFPFSNESVTAAVTEFGIISLDSRAVVDYHGDSDTGMVITLHPIGSCANITLYNVRTQEKLRVDTDKITAITGKAFDVGDDIVISTMKGDKYVKLLREGVYYNIIGALDRDSDLFQLTPGDNLFDYTTEPAEGRQNLMVSFKYHDAFGGV